MSNNTFVYKENDEEGLNTLKAIAKTHRFNRWMYEAIKPFLKGQILEVGSGIGNITQYVVADKFFITASDLRESYCSILNQKFLNNPYFTGVRNIDITHPDFDNEYHDLLEKFDSIFAINAIEHIRNDNLAVENCKKLLRNKGRIIVLVPAFQQLYNGFDKELHHFRRYTKSSLEALLTQAGFVIFKSKYFNIAGMFGWWFSGALLKNKILPPAQLSLFDKLVPIFKLLERLAMAKIGLSVISVGEK